MIDLSGSETMTGNMGMFALNKHKKASFIALGETVGSMVVQTNLLKESAQRRNKKRPEPSPWSGLRCTNTLSNQHSIPTPLA